MSIEDLEQQLIIKSALFLQEAKASRERTEMLKAQRRDSEWRLEIFKARLEVFDKRARLEEERAADFRSLTADFFVDVLRQYERINGTSQSGASNLFDYSTVRLIDLISNLDQKRFLAMLQPSSDEYYWLEPFSEIIQYRNPGTSQTKERLARRLTLPHYRYSADYYILVPLFQYAYEESIEEVIEEEAKRMRDLCTGTVPRDEGEGLGKWNEFWKSFRSCPRFGQQWMRLQE